MKKTNKKDQRFFKKVANFFDKKLITPISKLILSVSSKAQSSSEFFERLMSNKQVILVLSLLLALVIFFTNENKVTNLASSNAEVLYGQKVTAVYNEEAYVVEGLPEKVDVTIIGKQMDVYLAKLFLGDGVVANLQGLKPGVHKVKLQYKKTVQAVEYKLDPSEVTVIIREKMSESRTLEVDILNKDKLDKKLNIEKINLSTDKVIIKSSKEKLDKVASVKALVDLNRLANPKVDTVSLKDLPIYAYDLEGNKVDVEIVAEPVEAIIKISSPEKKVPIRVVTTGEPSGKSIKNIVPSVKEVTIYGDLADLAKINEVVVELDVTGLKEDKEYAVNIIKPQGVSDMSVSTIKVKLEVGEIYSKDFDKIQVNIEGLAPNLKASALSKTDSLVTVNVKGSKAVVDSLARDRINAYVDLKGLTAGEHEVAVKVEGDDSRLIYTPRTKKIKVRISAR